MTQRPIVAASVSRALILSTTLFQSISSLISDLVDRTRNTAAFFSEAVAPSDTVTRILLAFRNPSEDLGGTISDGVTRLAVMSRRVSQDLSTVISDSISKPAGKALSE